MNGNGLEMSPKKNDLKITITNTLFPVFEGCFRKNINFHLRCLLQIGCPPAHSSALNLLIKEVFMAPSEN